MNLPKFNLLYYKNILDKCIYSFFDECNDMFIRQNDVYVLALNISRERLHKYFKIEVSKHLKDIVKPYDILNPNYYLIIGGCIPKDNIMLKFKDSAFPTKLLKILDLDYSVHYILKEKDIKIDLVLFNQVMNDVFIDFFKSNILGKKYRNVMFIRHNNLDCHSIYKILKCIYGKSNCINMYESFTDKRSPIVAVNDLIFKYVNNKIAMNHSQEFKQHIAEIRQYVEQKLENING